MSLEMARPVGDFRGQMIFFKSSLVGSSVRRKFKRSELSSLAERQKKKKKKKVAWSRQQLPEPNSRQQRMHNNNTCAEEPQKGIKISAGSYTK